MSSRFAFLLRAQGTMGLREWIAWLLLALVVSLGASQIVRAQRADEADGAPRYQPKEGMAFEHAGENFPGSAFYYLDDSGSLALATPAVLTSNELGLGAGSDMVRGLTLAGSPLDHARALQCLTAAIYYEAAMEPDAGQQAVAQVVLNRVMHPSYPNTVCGVVYQGSERATGCQFTFSCDGAMARAPSAIYWARARRVAERALAGYVYRRSAPLRTITRPRCRPIGRPASTISAPSVRTVLPLAGRGGAQPRLQCPLSGRRTLPGSQAAHRLHGRDRRRSARPAGARQGL